MFLSREERERRKRTDEQINQLSQRLSLIEERHKARESAYMNEIEAYRAQMSEKWEYYRVEQSPNDDRPIEVRLDMLGSQG